MRSTARIAVPRRALAAVFVAVALAAVAIGALPGTSAAAGRHRVVTAKALAFHDAMRALWQSHGTWTERAIVDFVGGLPDTQIVVNRLLRNQTQIGNAVKPFYGRKAGNRLTALLRDHINAAVALLQAAKSGTLRRPPTRRRRSMPTAMRSRDSCTTPIHGIGRCAP
jgi:hypothetical protein